MVVTTQVRMANEIAAQFRHLPREAAITALAEHLLSFWDPRMRDQLLAAADQHDPTMDDLVVAAATRLRRLI